MSHKSRLVLIPAIALALALGGCSQTTAVKPEDKPATEEPAAVEEEPEPAKEGTRENPYPIGTTITTGDWSVTIDEVNLDATEALTADGFYELTEGNSLIYVKGTVQYNGDNPDGEYPIAMVDYVTADGNTIQQAWADTSVIDGSPDFTLITPLYAGASHTGVMAFEVPAATAGEGTLAVQPDALDKSFVAVK